MQKFHVESAEMVAPNTVFSVTDGGRCYVN